MAVRNVMPGSVIAALRARSQGCKARFRVSQSPPPLNVTKGIVCGYERPSRVHPLGECS